MNGAKFFLVLLAYVLCISGIQAANDAPQDSLYLEMRKPGLSKLELAELSYALAESYFPAELDSVLRYTDMGLNLSRGESRDGVEVDLEVLRARCLVYQGKQEQALDLLQDAEQTALQMDDTSRILKVFSALAITYTKMGRFDSSMQYDLKTLRLAELVQDSLAILKSYVKMGATMPDEHKASEFSLKAIELGEVMQEVDILTIAYNNLASYYSNEDQYEKAIVLFERALDLAMENQDSIDWAWPATNIGVTYLQLDRFEEAREHIGLALEIAKGKESEKELYAFSLMSMAELEMELNHGQKADDYIDLALTTASETKDPTLLEFLLNDLVTMAEDHKQFKRAFEWQSDLKVIRDSIYSADRMEKIEALEMEYKAQKKEAEIAQLQLEQKQNEVRFVQTIYVAVFGGVFLMMLILFMVWNSWTKARHNRKLTAQSNLIHEQNAALKSQNEQLNQLNEEMNALMGVVAHDLKAPISKAEGLLQILKANPDWNATEELVLDKMATVFGDGKDLIGELLIINELDAQSGELQMKAVNLYAFGQETVATFAEIAGRKSIQLHLEPPLVGETVRTHPPYLKRVLDNLISNAIKFSETDKQVWVSLRLQADNLCLQVRDEGPGISEDEIPKLFLRFSRLSNLPTAGESSTGLGMSIVKKLVDRLGGTIQVKSKLGQGTSVEVLLPR